VHLLWAPVKYHRRCGSQTNKYDFNSFANVKNDRDESRMAPGRTLQFVIGLIPQYMERLC